MPILPLLLHGALLARLVAPPYPFAVGERLEYDASLGMIPVGSATISVNPMTQERGRQAFVFSASGEARPMGLKFGAELTSYVGVQAFSSLRFHRKLIQGGSVNDVQFQIVPDSSRYRQIGDPRDWAAPPDPLDELAFLYYLRTARLKPGATYSISRYFQTGYNPVQVRVTGRETRALPDGRSAPVLTLEITSRGNVVTVALTDDARRLPVEIDLPLPFGRVTLALSKAS
ncbi:MAG: DUF3108 domain-containing protein [Gemmatimonadales bacterium]